MPFQKIRKLENAHIFIWLIKDMCWVTFSKTLGIAMILPTLSLAIYITFIHRKSISELAHNIAICSWICANSVWMIGEFYFQDTLRPYAVLFFAFGLIVISLYYFLALIQFVRKK